jgi:hypothetical protein
MRAKATRVADDNYSNMAKPGDYMLGEFVDGKPGRLTFNCPCGCDKVAAVSLKPTNPNGWDFDGNLECPTVHPSIDIYGEQQSHWHGWLKNGEFLDA